MGWWPRKSREPDLERELRAHLENERKHQMGIFLMREVMDEVNYTYRKGFQNELTLVKFV